jgi:hypothetical protein
MATTTFTGTNSWSNAGSWDNGVPGSGDDAVIDGVCTMDQDGDCATLTINAGDSLDQSTYDLDVVGLTTINGTHTMGTSSNTGLTTAGMTIGSAVDIQDYQTGSIINNSGNYSVGNTASFKNACRGKFTQTGDGNMACKHFKHRWYEFTCNASVTITATDELNLTRVDANKFELNGTIVQAGFLIKIGCGSSGSFIIGANADISGAGNVFVAIQDGATITINKSGTFTKSSGALLTWNSDNSGKTFVGFIRPFGSGVSYSMFNNTGTDEWTVKFHSGTHVTNLLSISSANADIVLDMTNDPNITVNGTFDFSNGSNGFTYTSSAEEWTTAGSINRNITLNGAVLNKLTVNNSTDSIKDTLQGDFSVGTLVLTKGILELKNDATNTITTMQGTGGTLQSDSGGTSATVTLTNASTVSSTFKDITMNAVNKINAKGGTNSGNNKGIVFTDKLSVL